MKVFLSVVFGVVLLCLVAGCEKGGEKVKMKTAPAVRPEALEPGAGELGTGAEEGKIPNSSSAPIKQ